MAIRRRVVPITSAANWCAASPRTTVRSWAPIFGDNRNKVCCLRWQWVLVLIAWLLGANSSGFGPAAVAQSTHKSNSAGTKDGSSPVSKRKSAKPITKKKRKRNSPRLRRMRQAFVASASLRPMARQLLQDRTPAAYAGVEAYARRHSKEDAGALAWLVVGYARVLDHDYAKAIDPLNYAKPRAGDLGDYVGYYLANAYLQTGK